MKTQIELEEATFYKFISQFSLRKISIREIYSPEHENILLLLKSRSKRINESFEFTPENIQKIAALNQKLRQKERHLLARSKKIINLMRFFNNGKKQQQHIDLSIDVYVERDTDYYEISYGALLCQTVFVDATVFDKGLWDSDEDWKESWMPEKLSDIKFCYTMHCLTCHTHFVTWQDIIDASLIEYGSEIHDSASEVFKSGLKSIQNNQINILPKKGIKTPQQIK